MGSIGTEELEEPLIGLGFADNTQDVEEMVKQVDEDGSGEIEFQEFLGIIQNNDGDEKSAALYKFFKGVTNGTIGGNNELSFNLLVSKMKRQHLMDAIMSSDPDKKKEGERILSNVAK